MRCFFQLQCIQFVYRLHKLFWIFHADAVFPRPACREIQSERSRTLQSSWNLEWLFKADNIVTDCAEQPQEWISDSRSWMANPLFQNGCCTGRDESGCAAYGIQFYAVSPSDCCSRWVSTVDTLLSSISWTSIEIASSMSMACIHD